jgi:hypothetical protein
LRGGYSLFVVRLIGSLTGHEAVNGYLYLIGGNSAPEINIAEIAERFALVSTLAQALAGDDCMTLSDGSVLRYKKPYPSFPLTSHKKGWCKKINGKVKVICGHVPPKEALEIFRRRFAELYSLPVIGGLVNAEPVQSVSPSPVLVAPVL